MPKGIALHLGLNTVNPAHYGGWTGDLTACEADAADMAAISQPGGYQVTTLLTKDATRNAVRSAIKHAGTKLTEGDIFFLTYSGHGGQLPDKNDDEPDGLDETWCLYDGQLVDDELYALFGAFAAGVRIFSLSDSCHSGSVLKNAKNLEDRVEGIRNRAMPMEIAMRTYRDNRGEYDPILTDTSLTRARDEVKASGLLISGCQDNQLSSDGPFNGLFTATLLRVWNNGSFSGSYADLHRAIVKRMPASQTPNFFHIGPGNLRFDTQRPFSI